MFLIRQPRGQSHQIRAILLAAEASERQLGLTREMAAYISPRPSFTHHPLTLHAAAQMIDLVERAGHFRTATLV